MIRSTLATIRKTSGAGDARRGAVIVMAAALMILILAFVAFSVDVGYIAMTKAQLQNAVDAAALAGAQELNPYEPQGKVAARVRQAASDVAERHRAGNEPRVSVAGHAGKVELGRRTYDPDRGQFRYEWGAEPFNIVRVTASRTAGRRKGQAVADNRLPLLFAPVIGHDKASIEVSAVATFQPRDIMLVLDYSASMNDDSELAAIDSLGRSAVIGNIRQMWEDLGSPVYGKLDFEPQWVTVPGQPASGAIPHIDVTWQWTSIDVASTKDLSNVVLEFDNGRREKFDGLKKPRGTFSGTGSNRGRPIVRCWIKSGSNDSGAGPGYGEGFDFFDNANIRRGLGLDAVPYPYPSGRWDDYIEYARSHRWGQPWYDSDVEAAGYRAKFGLLTLINFWNKNKPMHRETPDLWKASQQPITALKDATDLFLDYLVAVNAEDQVGLSVYTFPQSDGAKLESPLVHDYKLIKKISRERQAGHYDHYTNIGAGMRTARQELETNSRRGAVRMMVLMTDGIANRSSTGASPRQFALDEAELARRAGIKITTTSLGVTADTALMQEIADITQGTHFNVPGGRSVNQYERELKRVFGEIAADRPLKLIRDVE
ncbi:MAG: VWA domain-containing protein [Planctomycetes bacterium]|nr:VWA domain-containing protein [Planctomycetota bacterium]